MCESRQQCRLIFLQSSAESPQEELREAALWAQLASSEEQLQLQRDLQLCLQLYS